MTSLEGYTFRPRNLLGIEGLNRLDIEILLERGNHFVNLAGEAPPAFLTGLTGLTVATLFPGEDHNAQASFENTARQLGAKVVATSPAAKGETLTAIAARLNALKPDLAALRHQSSGTVRLLSHKFSCPVINAGDGAREDPMTALADALAIRDHLGDTSGLTLAICGDILNSAIARSHIYLLNILGGQIRLIAPPALMPPGADDWGATAFTDMREGLKGCDVAIMLPGAPEPSETGAWILRSGQQTETLAAIHAAVLEALAQKAAR